MYEAHSDNKELSSVPHDFEVLLGMNAGENPTYSFLKLELTYVLHINTEYFFHSFNIH